MRFNVHLIQGPGIWLTTIKDKEQAAAREVCTVLNEIADSLWSQEDETNAITSKSANDIDDEILRELKALTAKKKVPSRLETCLTDTPCLAYIVCKPPLDPLTMIDHYMMSVETTGATRLRFAQRLIPIMSVAAASKSEVVVQAQKLIDSSFPKESTTFKVDVTIRNHTTLQRDDMIQTVANLVPKDQGHEVKLDGPRIIILLVIFKGLAMMSILGNFDRFRKYNPHQVQSARAGADESLTRVA